ncbi:MAG TPA: STAS/SEC14 domain-containing protein [Pirellulales bacterium]|nr:STAS/SEC14 domain-containing protein [Pirellulales bacterium]
MPVTIQEEAGGKTLVVGISGKLTKEDYHHFIPEVERLIKAYGKVRMMVTMHDFHGWEAGALWEDIKFDAKHFKDIERLALVGETKWEKGMATFCKPFTTAKVKYFDQKDAAQAHAWLAEA